MSTQNTAVAKQPDKNMTDIVLKRVQNMMKVGDLKLPQDYSPENALKAAYLILSETVDKSNVPVLQACTKASVGNALLNMVVDGLNPLKKQCYFVAYGKKLVYQRSYMGNYALAKRVAELERIFAEVIYEGDEVVYTIDSVKGIKSVTQHKQDFKNIDNNKITGAYAVLFFADGTSHTDIMTMADIRTSWMQGQAKGQSPAHKGFPGEMAKRTVINRALKLWINASTDANLYSQDPDLRETDDDIPMIPDIPEDAEIIDFDEREDDSALIEDNIDKSTGEIKPEPKQVTTKQEAAKPKSPVQAGFEMDDDSFAPGVKSPFDQ